MITSNKPQVMDLGTIKSGDVVTHSFKIRNEYSAPVFIDGARASCGCTVPMLTSQSLQPKEEMEIKFTFNSKGRQGVTTKKIHVSYIYEGHTHSFSQSFKATIVL